MSGKSLSRRRFLEMVAALGASGALAWAESNPVGAVEDPPYVGVDMAEAGGDETVVVTKGGAPELPFVPYCLAPGEKWADYGVVIYRED